MHNLKVIDKEIVNLGLLKDINYFYHDDTKEGKYKLMFVYSFHYEYKARVVDEVTYGQVYYKTIASAKERIRQILENQNDDEYKI